MVMLPANITRQDERMASKPKRASHKAKVWTAGSGSTALLKLVHLRKIDHDLASEAQYHALRKLLAKRDDTQIVIWHERLLAESITAREQWAEICKEEEERPEDDWVKKNGWKIFSPDLDPEFNTTLKWNIYDSVNNDGVSCADMM